MFKRRQILKTVKVLTGLYSWGQEGNRVLGKIFVNHVIASSRWSPPSALVTLRSSLGTFVGNKAHRLCPDTRLFHALVPRGSMWIPVPERAGPITNHLKKYRSDKIKTLLVSKCVLMNKPKRKMTDFHLKFSLIPLTIHYCAILTRFQCVGKLLYGKTKGIRSSKSRVSVIWSFYTVFFTCMGAFSSLQQI